MMTIQLNKQTNNFELIAGGAVMMKISVHECNTKKLAQNYFERCLANMLTTWTPIQKDS